MNPVENIILNKYDEAVKFFNEGNIKKSNELLTGLLKENETDYDVLNFLGIIRLNEGKYSEAAEFFERVVSICSYHQEAYYNLGLCYQNMNDYDRAEQNYHKVLGLNSTHFDTINNLGLIYLNRKDYQQAEDCFKFCLSLNPDSAVVYNNLGNSILATGKTAEGLSCYKKAVELEPRNAVFIYNLGMVYSKSEDYPRAIECFEKAISLNPDYDEAFIGLSVVYTRLSDFVKSEEYLLKVPKNTFTKALLYSNKGLVKLLQCKIDEALENFNLALSFEPEHPEIHYSIAHTLLVSGNYEQGWKEYEWRRKKEEFKGCELKNPLTEEIDINGKRILIKDEQGLGDSIQFVRYIPLLKQKGACTIFECSGRLIPLYKHIKEIDEIYPRENENPSINFDYDISLLSLPGYFHTNEKNIPANIPYLRAEEEYLDKWKKLIKDDSSLKVGIVWAGNPKHTADKRRSCKLADFAPLFNIEGIEFFTLQKGTAIEQANEFADSLNILDEYDNSFLDTAAIIQHLDLVITVDTSIAHLSGALGKKTWVLLPFLPDWRWLLGRNDTPWYPTAKLFRQDSPENWGSVFEQVKSELQTVVNKKAGMKEMSKRRYQHIDNYFDEIEKHIYPEPVSDVHNEITRGVIKKLTEIFQFPKDIKILDIGCGQGPALDTFSSYGFSPEGITLGEEDVNICRKKGYAVSKMDQTFLEFNDNTFDLIWARHVLEHSIMPLFTLLEYRRVTKNGGIIYIEVPGEGTSAHHENNPNHYSVLTQRMWLSLFSKAGLHVLESFTIPLTLQCGPDEYYGFILRCEKENEITKGLRNNTVYLGLSQGENFGWGVCSKYIKKELSKKAEVVDLNENKELLSNGNVKGSVIHALANIDFDPLFNVRGEVNIGYTFFENELNDNSVKNSKNYDLILAGSTWCKDKLLAKGINNTDVLLQGIDPEIFYPGEVNKNENLFVIFSGGKFEFRKGQDLVLKAVKILQQKYNDIILVNAWYNLWHQFLRSMANSKHIEFELKGNTWEEFTGNLYNINGIDHKRIITLPLVPNNKLRDIYLKSDIGLFPNRCEGGTNLVMMEYMACGKTVVASFNTGHKDILNNKNSFMLDSYHPVKLYSQDGKLECDWSEPAVEEIIEKIEAAYHNRDTVKLKGRQAAADMMNLTWDKTADNLLKFLE